MSKQDQDENAVSLWRKTADDNDIRAQHLEELAYEMRNLDHAGFMLEEVQLLRSKQSGSATLRPSGRRGT